MGTLPIEESHMWVIFAILSAYMLFHLSTSHVHKHFVPLPLPFNVIVLSARDRYTFVKKGDTILFS